MTSKEPSRSLMDGYNAAFVGAYEGGASHFVFGSMPYDHRSIPDVDIAVKTISDEKAALSFAFGLSLSGKRTVCLLSSIPFDLASMYGFTGVNGALVILYVEDNDRIGYDSRSFWSACNYPVFEPSDPYEIKRFIKISFNFSEKYDIPVVIRVHRRLLDSFCYVERAEKKEIKDKPFKKDPSKYVLLPSTLKLCREDAEIRRLRIAKDVDSFPVNTVTESGGNIGFIASGPIARSIKECISDASIFSIGISNPLPISRIKEFADKYSKLYVIEEHPFIELELIKNGISCVGEALFPSSGPRTVREIASQILKKPVVEKRSEHLHVPDMCESCGFGAVLSKVKDFKYPIFTDNGCGVLGAISLGSTEVGIKYSLPTALAFGEKDMCVCVLTYREFCDQFFMINDIVLSNVIIVVPVSGSDHEKYLPFVKNVHTLTDKEFDKMDEINKGIYFVVMDQVCCYEN